MAPRIPHRRDIHTFVYLMQIFAKISRVAPWEAKNVLGRAKDKRGKLEKSTTAKRDSI